MSKDEPRRAAGAWGTGAVRAGKAGPGNAAGAGRKRSFTRMLVVSVLTLLLEGALGVAVLMVYQQTLETPNVGNVQGTSFLLLALVLGAALLGPVVTLLVVLPAVWLGDALGRRFGGRERWWWVLPPAAVLPLIVLLPRAAATGSAASLADGAAQSLILTAVIAAPALTSRSRARSLLTKVAVGGTAAVLVTACAGEAALSTGLLKEYRPPVLSPAALVGTWSDGRGGTLDFAADGTVIATGVDFESLDRDSREYSTAECDGRGTWTYSPGRDTWTQAVDVSVGGCTWDGWNVGGDTDRIDLYQYVGDPDLWVLYVLHEVGADTQAESSPSASSRAAETPLARLPTTAAAAAAAPTKARPTTQGRSST